MLLDLPEKILRDYLNQKMKWKCLTSLDKTEETQKIDVVRKTRKDKFLPMMDPKYSWVLGEVNHYSSDFTSKSKNGEFISSFHICSDELVDFVIAKLCSPSDRVSMKSRPDCEDFSFVYKYFF